MLQPVVGSAIWRLLNELAKLLHIQAAQWPGAGLGDIDEADVQVGMLQFYALPQTRAFTTGIISCLFSQR